ncbi:hypothetical protein EXU57_09630 [Segetibacter sp. 3557_3]|uniref:protein-disulfide reductase DsbD domain-containing protein n=1 Tax=Segetibacter sp. 3557_3 TaxID=2547429 RepID=UPI001058FD5E|nr:protein-disulfide reductase DsbD domain-containing protein [Segetibacter sp. 3557_3]TDH27048.1 hypothetical protein EXU57_09630 [Segetibacter sp. 3557_3]
MKKIFLFILTVIITTASFSQVQNPVKWNYTAKKINPTTYEIYLTANVSGNWHLYSQFTPDGGPVPTAITFAKNPLVTLQGKAKEVGKLQQKHEPLFGVDVKQFGGTVNFVQTVKLKSPVKTNIAGSVEYMVCDDTQCLPPATQKFSIALK